MSKPAKTRYPIDELLAQRWTVRAFSDRPIEADKIRCLFEAARWAPSSFNEQPWRFIVATRNRAREFDTMTSCLMDKNQRWVRNSGVPLLMIVLSKKTFAHNGKQNRVHLHDIGLAMGNLSIQATAMGLSVCQMQGILLDRVMHIYGVPVDFEPTVGCAVGYPGELRRLPPEFHERELRQRTRADFTDFVFEGTFGKPADLFAGTGRV